MSEKEYEFTADQNRDLDVLHKRLNTFTIIFVIAGLLILAIAIRIIMGPEGMRALPVIGVGLAIVTLGILLRKPLENIKNIIETEGRDISELMIAVKDFSRAFLSGIITSIIFLILLIWRIIAVFTA